MTQPDLPLSRYTLPRCSTEAFEAYHKANPDIYVTLRAWALCAKHSGRKRGSMKSIVESVRWDHSGLWAHESPFKLDNSMTAFYARKLAEDEPELAGFFETRGRR